MRQRLYGRVGIVGWGLVGEPVVFRSENRMT